MRGEKGREEWKDKKNNNNNKQLQKEGGEYESMRRSTIGSVAGVIWPYKAHTHTQRL